MAMSYISYLVALIVSCFLVHESSVRAIYCFQCNSLLDPDCANIQPNDTSSRHYKLCDETEQKEYFCRKIIQTIHDRGGMVRVIRKCGWILHHRDCYTVSNKGHEDISCQCFHNGCNGAHSSYSKPSYVFLLIVSSVPFFYLFK